MPSPALSSLAGAPAGAIPAADAPAATSMEEATLPRPRALTQHNDGPRRLRGYVKTYCPFKGYGIVKCEGVPGAFPRDVRFDKNEAEKCGGVTAGATISFVLRQSEEGRLTAAELKVLITGVWVKERVSRLIGIEIDWSRTYAGTIRDIWRGGKESIFNVASMAEKDPGGSFIVSEEAHKVFKLDIWAYPSKLPNNAKIGDVVKFKVEIDSWWSYPVAYNCRAADPAVADAIRASTATKVAEATKRKGPVKQMPQNILRLDASIEEVCAHFKAIAAEQSSTIEEVCAEFTAAALKDVDTNVEVISDKRIDGHEDKRSATRTHGHEDVNVFSKSPPSPILKTTRENCKAETVHQRGEHARSLLAAERSKTKWQQYKGEDGGFWWWCEVNNDWFLEDEPGPWAKYFDPSSRRHYWWRDNATWFWV